MAGFQREGEDQDGFEIYVVRGWDYAALVDTYQRAAAVCRAQHVPVLVHVTELTQPQGHSTSGLARALQAQNPPQLGGAARLPDSASASACSPEGPRHGRRAGRKSKKPPPPPSSRRAPPPGPPSLTPSRQERDEAAGPARISLVADSRHRKHQLRRAGRTAAKPTPAPIRADIVRTLRRALRQVRGDSSAAPAAAPRAASLEQLRGRKRRPLQLQPLQPERRKRWATSRKCRPNIAAGAPLVDGREVLQACFTANFSRDPPHLRHRGGRGPDWRREPSVRRLAGEVWRAARDRHRHPRNAPSWGRASGRRCAACGPSPRFSTLITCFTPFRYLSDDLACLQYRTKGGQKAPLIVHPRPPPGRHLALGLAHAA
ncbi:MAG: hypothetical protein WKG07_41380 [Hymenobacter sp.]